MSQEEMEDLSWQCNGSVLFVGGCKSGQTTFDVHPNDKAWRCLHVYEDPDINNESYEGDGLQECDFDLCEMCVRWTVHCEKTGTDLELVDQSTLSWN